jgi:hypothetical protein
MSFKNGRKESIHETYRLPKAEGYKRNKRSLRTKGLKGKEYELDLGGNSELLRSYKS